MGARDIGTRRSAGKEGATQKFRRKTKKKKKKKKKKLDLKPVKKGGVLVSNGAAVREACERKSVIVTKPGGSR